ncbi:hypothetical protein C8Q78DRAFT_225075 [Trametes maxima]|nr:hypothetical protein C8Q78DRAFT_225075 [Trametes maxima]
MPNRPIEASPRKYRLHKTTRSHHNAHQHGHAHHTPLAASGTSVLLSIPPESLTHVTSFLDPPELLALARTCKPLHAHVADDNTWRRAYVYQYLGITPESDLRDGAGNKTLMLRREEHTWKKEFVLRYNLRRYVIASRELGGRSRWVYFLGSLYAACKCLAVPVRPAKRLEGCCHACGITIAYRIAMRS